MVDNTLGTINTSVKLLWTTIPVHFGFVSKPTARCHSPPLCLFLVLPNGWNIKFVTELFNKKGSRSTQPSIDLGPDPQYCIHVSMFYIKTDLHVSMKYHTYKSIIIFECKHARHLGLLGVPPPPPLWDAIRYPRYVLSIDTLTGSIKFSMMFYSILFNDE